MKESLALESYEWVDPRDGQYYLAVDIESEDTYETAVRREVLRLAEENARIKTTSRELEKALEASINGLASARDRFWRLTDFGKEFA